MSCIFVIAPMVISTMPLFYGAIAAAAGTLGYKAITSVNEQGQELVDLTPADRHVEVSMEGSQIVADAMQRDSQFTIHRDDVTATFKREADGRCTVHVAGTNRTDQELEAIGKELVGKVTQHYAYNKVMSQLKNQGFTVTNEEVTNDQTIRIRVSKYV